MASSRISTATVPVTIVTHFSTLSIGTLLLLISVVLPVWSASLPGPLAARFINPCSGSKSVIVDEEDWKSGDVPNDALLGDTFERLAHKTDSLRKRVKELKKQYVSKRFKDTRVVNDLDEIGLILNGMPSTHPATVSTIGRSQVVAIVHQAFDDLARLSVFIDQARVGEFLAENEHITFEHDFATLEDHHEEGLYLILCSLHTVSRTLGKPITSDIYQEILDLKVTEVDRNALRHTRDYLVLRDFEKILARIEIHFAALKQLHES